MPACQKLILFVSLCLLSVAGSAQATKMIDSLKLELAKTTEVKEQVKLLDRISRMLMSGNPREADKYGKDLIQVAEKSRDREMMARAYISNGVRCSYFSGTGDYTERANGYYEKAKKISRDNKLYPYQVSVLIKQSELHLGLADKEKAAEYLDQATSIASNIKDDSLQVEVKLATGDVRTAKNEKIEALRSYLSALRLAEKIKNDMLVRESYLKISGFYANIEDYDKAIDYYALAYKKLDDLKRGGEAYQRVMDVNRLGQLYSFKKNYELAIEHYEDALAMADSVHYETLKVPVYLSLLNVYLQMDEPHRSMEFMESEAGGELKSYLSAVNMAPMIDQAYGIIYSEMGHLDSAGKYLERSVAFFENSPSPIIQMNGFFNLAKFYKKKGDYKKAIELLSTVKELAEKTGQLEVSLEVNKNLDSLYNITGDYQQSRLYAAAYFQYKDSLQKINKEKELTQVEAQDEQARQQKLAEEAAEQKRQRNNIQYLAITIGIATLFLLMVVFGMFRVSARTIRMVGFFAFLMFFEFIFLIFKKNIHDITHGEPWMDLLFMIGLAAILLPFHHWVEHRVLRYLTSTNQLTTAGSALKSKIFRKSGRVMDGKV